MFFQPSKSLYSLSILLLGAMLSACSSSQNTASNLTITNSVSSSIPKSSPSFSPISTPETSTPAQTFLEEPTPSFTTASMETSKETPSPKQTIDKNGDTVTSRFKPLEGYTRRKTTAGTFASYLQNAPLKPDGSPVLLFDGSERTKKNHHTTVLDYDVGKFDLQQCADSILRLRCEYFYEREEYDQINFHVSSTMEFPFTKWAQGYTLKPDENNQLVWLKDDENNATYASFRHYLNRLFLYAGTMSLQDDTVKQNFDDISIGDMFINPGSPGHSVIIMDIAENKRGELICLLAEGHTPAQSMHITNNIENPEMGAWYPLQKNGTIKVQTATFSMDSLRKFPS